MLDNLRDQESSPLFQDEDDNENNEILDLDFKTKNNRKIRGNFLGLKSQQLFILLVLLLMVVFLLGAMFLLVTGKIVPPFL